MTLKSIYRKCPSHTKAIELLEGIIWPEGPICPYCRSKQYTQLKKEDRYHCNVCNASFSVTVHSIFRRTRSDLQKWFLAIYLFKTESNLSARSLADKIDTTKDSAWLMLQKIKRAERETPLIIENIFKKIRS